MTNMHPTIQSFISLNHIACLSTLLSDGGPHGAAMHYVSLFDPFRIIFRTSSTAKKVEALSIGQSMKASCVVGCDTGATATLQIDGDIMLLEGEQLEQARTAYLTAFPDRPDKDDSVYLLLTPTWYRYTAFVPGSKPEVISSE